MELTHRYGPQVHVLDDAYSRALATHLSHGPPDLRFHALLRAAFRHLFAAACAELPTVSVAVPTRMAAVEPRAVLDAVVPDPAHLIALVDIARGGMVPCDILQSELLALVPPENVRVDHLYLQRVAGPDGHVAGVSNSGSKLGGRVDGATVFIPDPMGATGGSVATALELYRALGPARRVVALHLIITPEYVRRITLGFPEVAIYALRLDRGLSPPDVLATVPGERWAEERGLNAHDYIVPGAGGLGELINNVNT